MSSRDSILTRLRAAPGRETLQTPEVRPDRQTFADYPAASLAALKQQFIDKMQALRGECYPAHSEEHAARILQQLLEDDEAFPALVQDAPLLRGLLASAPALLEKCTLHRVPLPSPEFATFAAGITLASALVARTGSILLHARNAGGRRLSVLPPLHIAVARESQLVPSLDAALKALQADEADWSYATIITGPSRTADIQKNLVLGAHGPKRLAVILLSQGAQNSVSDQVGDEQTETEGNR